MLTEDHLTKLNCGTADAPGSADRVSMERTDLVHQKTYRSDFTTYKEDQRSPLVVCLKQYPTFVLAHFGLKDIGVAASYLVSPLNLAVTY